MITLTLIRFVIGLGNSYLLLNQSEAKCKPISTWLHAFSRALGKLLLFTSHSPLVIFSFVLIVCCHYRVFFCFVSQRSIEMCSVVAVPVLASLGDLYLCLEICLWQFLLINNSRVIALIKFSDLASCFGPLFHACVSNDLLHRFSNFFVEVYKFV